MEIVQIRYNFNTAIWKLKKKKKDLEQTLIFLHFSLLPRSEISSINKRKRVKFEQLQNTSRVPTINNILSGHTYFLSVAAEEKGNNNGWEGKFRASKS